MTMCWKCGKAIRIDGVAGRTMICDSCGADVRSCKNCRHFSPGSFHDCAERVEDSVTDKERANFCDSFQLNPLFRSDHAAAGKGSPAGAGLANPSDRSNSARNAFDTLFKS
jgi:hypothetical protein